jgi:uncharacterized integral membrane protein
MRYVKVLVIVLIFFVGLVFFVQNTQTLATKLTFNIDLFGWSWASSPIPIYLFILIAFALGAIISMLYFLMDKIRHGKELRKARSRIKDLEQELSSLRNMPLDEQPTQQQTEDTSQVAVE